MSRMATERLSDVMRRRPWHPEMKRRYLTRMLLTCAVIIVLGSILLDAMIRSIPEEESPPQTVQELLEAIQPQIVNR